MSLLSSAWNRGIRWRHSVENASPGWTQTLLVIRVSCCKSNPSPLPERLYIFPMKRSLLLVSFATAFSSPLNSLSRSLHLVTEGKTWCGIWWIKSSRASRRSSTVSSLWATRSTASTLSTCWWRWVTMCGQLRTLTRPRTSARLWEMCWSPSRGTLTNALWVESKWWGEFLFVSHCFCDDVPTFYIFFFFYLSCSHSPVRSDRWRKWRFLRKAKLVSCLL